LIEWQSDYAVFVEIKRGGACRKTTDHDAIFCLSEAAASQTDLSAGCNNLSFEPKQGGATAF